jgi:predicted N-acetyltransferase YhbS
VDAAPSVGAVLLRPLTPDDVPAAQQLSFATFAELDGRLGDPVPELTDEVRQRGEQRIAHLERTDPDGAWAAEDDGRLVGVALSLRRGPLWFLSLLTVEPGRQGQGTGRRLLEAALRTAEGAQAGWILSSPDPKALRRYARAGFDPHPGYDARGVPDRSALPAGLGVREGDLGVDGPLVEDVVALLRGVGYGPDLDLATSVGARVLVAEDGADRGFALLLGSRVASVGATTPRLAQRLLWAGLAEAESEVEVGFLTADQQWAVRAAVDAGLALKPGSSSCRRGALGPLTPYLPTGAYG